jgi:hypothetical protein
MPKNTCFIAAALVAFGGPALADVTAADVWADFQAYTANTGQSLTAENQSMSGDTLTVSGVTLSMEMPEGQLTGNLGDLAFQELGDGRVSVIVPDEYSLALQMAFEGEEVDEGKIDMVIRHTGLEMIASGTPEKTLYTYTAPEMSVAFDQFFADDESFPMDFDSTMTALAGEFEMTDGDPMDIRSEFNAGEMNMAVAFTTPPGASETGAGKLTMSMSSLSGTTSGTMSNIAGMVGLGQMIEQGLRSDSNLSYSSVTFEATGSGDGQTFDIAGSSGTGQLNVGVGPEGLTYKGEANDLTLRAAGSEIPLPDASLAIEQYAWTLDMPIAVSEDPQDFVIKMGLIGLSLSDMLWAMFDPGEAIPRDPATLIIDLAGQANWLIDVTNPEIGKEPIEQMPGQIHALAVNEVRLSLAGAELSGTGDFVFDNSAGPTVPPVPVGSVDLRLVGGNSLIDKLVNLGFVPQEQAMGARMMLGLLARPGEGEDTLVSKIELTPTGGILANGQQLR